MLLYFQHVYWGNFLTKPFETEELIVRVRALLKRSSKIPKTFAVRDLLTYKEITLLPETYSVQINDKVQKLFTDYISNNSDYHILSPNNIIS